jgi:type II secretory pathway component PulF
MIWTQRATRKFSRQLAMLLESDVPLHEAIEIIGFQQRSRRWSRTSHEIAKSLEEGQKLSWAMHWHRWAFRPGYIEVVEWAEHRGRLKDLLIALRLLAEDYTPVPPTRIEEPDDDEAPPKASGRHVFDIVDHSPAGSTAEVSDGD